MYHDVIVIDAIISKKYILSKLTLVHVHRLSASSEASGNSTEDK